MSEFSMLDEWAKSPEVIAGRRAGNKLDLIAHGVTLAALVGIGIAFGKPLFIATAAVGSVIVLYALRKGGITDYNMHRRNLVGTTSLTLASGLACVGCVDAFMSISSPGVVGKLGTVLSAVGAVISGFAAYAAVRSLREERQRARGKGFDLM